jgi:hypothetical protein
MKRVYAKLQISLLVEMGNDVCPEEVINEMNYAFDMPENMDCKLVDYYIQDFDLTEDTLD